MSVRLLVITDLFPPISFGGYEQTCAELVEALQPRHEVTVLTSDLRRDAAEPRPWVLRELTYLGPERRHLLRVPRAAVHAAQVTRRLLDELRPELVYVSNCLGVPQAAPYVAAEAGVPVVYRLSELWFASTLYRGDRFVGHLFPGQRGWHRPWSRAVRAVNRHPALRLDTSRRPSAAISWCSDDLRARANLPPTVRPVLERTIYPAPRSDFERLTRRPSTPPTIAYVGRVTTAKGAEVAVRALSALRTRHDAKLVVAGPCQPADARRIERLVAKLGLASHVELVGRLETVALRQRLEQASALVVPTVTHEAFGTVCVEGALAGVPVVASKLGGIPEALHDGEHALLFPPGDVDACAAALARTLEDRAGTEARVRRARERARLFSRERHVAATEALLDEAADVLREPA